MTPITWKFVEESMFPLTVNDCRRAGIDTDKWAMGQTGHSGRELLLVEGTARVRLIGFATPRDADLFMQGMRFVAARLMVPDVHPRETTTTTDTEPGDTPGV